MAINVWPVNAVSNNPTYAGRQLRQTTNAPFVSGATAARPLGATSGVRPGTSTATVTATSTTWSCAPVAGVVDAQAAAEAGPYTFSNDGTVSGSLTAADASNPRVDIVYVQVNDPAESDGSSTPGATIGYLAGTAAASPSAPATPARSLVLARINVPKSGGGTPTVTWVARTLTAAGGTLPFNALSVLTGITGGYAGQLATVVGDSTATNNGVYSWTGTAWVRISPLLQQFGTQAITGSNANGDVSVPHSLGVVPSQFFPQWYGTAGGSEFTVRVAGMTATNVTLRIYYNGSVWASQSGLVGSGVYWQAVV
ncbi:hypothetical protein [Curtobacterium sp. USHLN213]|uniref:hypothetical protein n=1 Tax=Curtobacterium sp. USHLN213 TaxID=3081255 RepID=UPI00301AA3DA